MNSFGLNLYKKRVYLERQKIPLFLSRLLTTQLLKIHHAEGNKSRLLTFAFICGVISCFPYPASTSCASPKLQRRNQLDKFLTRSSLEEASLKDFNQTIVVVICLIFFCFYFFFQIIIQKKT